MGQSLEQFVHDANVERYEALLKSCRDDAQRRQLQKLLSEARSAGVCAAALARVELKSRDEARR